MIGLNNNPYQEDHMPLSDFIIFVFCVIDDEMKRLNLNNLRHRGFQPGLADSETITLEIVGEFLGIDTDKGIWKYFKTHWLHFFPEIPCRTTFVRQAANLWRVKQLLQEDLANACGASNDILHVIDGLPMKVCTFGHAYNCLIFKDIARYGYCAAKNEYYYGFKGHLVISSKGIISSSNVTAANIDERDVAPSITTGIHGLLLGDKGYIRPELTQDMEERGLKLVTPMRSNMQEGVWEKEKGFFGNARRIIETVISQLSERLNIEVVRARDLWHLTSRWFRKLLAHTTAVWINKMRNAADLDFDGLITSP
jgi:hypothetical protein